MRALRAALLAGGLLASAAPAAGQAESTAAAPLAVGESWTIRSEALGETRRINVYRPATYGEPDEPLPVLYMPDGGVAEDFVHVAGLVQVLSGNGGIRPHLLVGIENTERRRDLTGPTEVAADRAIAPRVGGSAAFRRFVRDELIPEVERRYRVTGERALVGESLAGLFVMETLVAEPALFGAYFAFDPSLWWNDGSLAREAAARLRARPGLSARLWIAASGEPEIAALTRALAADLAGVPGLTVHHEPMPEETHATLFHPAALRAFRAVLAPAR